MTQDCVNYRNMKNEVFRLYLAGYEAGDISGRTDLPPVRVQRWLTLMIIQDPALYRHHLRARQPGRRKTLRWPSAQLVMAPGEMHRSNEEY